MKRIKLFIHSKYSVLIIFFFFTSGYFLTIKTTYKLSSFLVFFKLLENSVSLAICSKEKSFSLHNGSEKYTQLNITSIIHTKFQTCDAATDCKLCDAAKTAQMQFLHALFSLSLLALQCFHAAADSSRLHVISMHQLSF